MSTDELRTLVDRAFADRSLVERPEVKAAIVATIALLDQGRLRVASQEGPGRWHTHAWVKRAVLLYFAVAEMQDMEAGPLAFRDKIPPKRGLEGAGVRVVPPGVIRYGAHVARNAVIMPAFVNIGAYVGAGTMVDTWATVGSCAQIGAECHLAGGVGIGGVLEPESAQPVIVEDGCFLGSRCVVVEGVLIEREAVIGAGVMLTSSTPIIDVSGPAAVELRGRVPARSVVIPGVRPKRFPAGEYLVSCAYIIGQRSESTDRKTSLNRAVREFNVSL